MKLASWNIAGLRNKAEDIEHECSDYDIVFLQETRLSEDVELPLFHQFKEYHNISKTKGQQGVSILINNDLDCDIISHKEPEDGRILVVKLKFKGKTLYLINIYMPYVEKPDTAKLKQKQEMFDTIQKQLISLKGNHVIVGADMNAGRSVTTYDIYARKDPHKQPGFSEDEIAMFEKFRNAIPYTDVQKEVYPKRIKYSYFSKRTKKPKQMFENLKGLTVDYFFVSPSLKSSIKHFDIDYDSYDLSDHCLLELTIK